MATVVAVGLGLACAFGLAVGLATGLLITRQSPH
jgi:ribose/xylose/arabinose/galactoside ABC-type transport system permease subunit